MLHDRLEQQAAPAGASAGEPDGRVRALTVGRVWAATGDQAQALAPVSFGVCVATQRPMILVREPQLDDEHATLAREVTIPAPHATTWRP